VTVQSACFGRGRSSFRRTLVGTALVLAWSSSAYAAGPGESRQACVDAYEAGQKLRLRARLAEARQEFLSCAQPSCPEAISSECLHFLADIRGDVPTVVLSAVDQHGNDLVNVQVTIDGAAVAEKLDGLAIDVDPGPHLVRYTAAGCEPVQQYVVIRQGEKNRVISARLVQPSPPLPVPSRRPILAYALGGVSLAGFVGAGALYLAARNQRDDLRSTCAPYCDPSEVNEVRGKLLASSISLAVGAAAAAGAVTVLLIRARSSSANTELTVVPTRTGAFGTVAVRF
jgi:hypothetical protein